MDRSVWLEKIRGETEERYDTIWARFYGEKFGLYSNATHLQFIQKFLSFLPLHSTILDAACGAGRYAPSLLEKGHRVVGIDQSQGMLSQLKARYPEVEVEKIGLQEMSFQEKFDGIICMDAMENICPEDWPVVVTNFYRALTPQAYLYFTVEIADDGEVEKAFNRAEMLGLPVVYGEWLDETVYHFYPSMAQVWEWLKHAGMELRAEGEGDDYHHFITRKSSPV